MARNGKINVQELKTSILAQLENYDDEDYDQVTNCDFCTHIETCNPEKCPYEDGKLIKEE